MRLNDAIGHLAAVMIDWGGDLVNPNYARISDAVAWSGFDASHHPQFMTVDDVREMERKGQYSFQVACDGSILQMLYQFDGRGELIGARLGYYAARPICPDPVRPPEETVPAELANKGEQVTPDDPADAEQIVESAPAEVKDATGPVPSEVESVETGLPISWLRLDYEPKSAKGVLHTAAHLQASLGPDLRVPTQGVPTPAQWVDSVFAWFYPEVYKARHMDDKGEHRDGNRPARINRQPLACEEHPYLKDTTFLSVPVPRVRPVPPPAAASPAAAKKAKKPKKRRRWR